MIDTFEEMDNDKKFLSQILCPEKGDLSGINGVELLKTVNAKKIETNVSFSLKLTNLAVTTAKKNFNFLQI